MRVCLLLLVTFFHFLPSSVSAQRKLYEEALILTKAGDTIECFVSLQLEYGDQIQYRRSLDASAEQLDAENIQTIVTAHMILENVIVGKREELMTLVVSGKANLYSSVSVTPASYNSTTNAHTSESISVSYVIKKDGRCYNVSRLNFRKDVSELFNDCPAVMQKILSKEYKVMDMGDIVREYNECASG